MKTHTHILLCGLAIGWLAACNTFNPVVPNPDTNNPKDSVATNPSDNPDIPDSSATTNPSLRNLSYLFDINALPEITITLTEHDWNTYLSNLDKWEKNGLYVPASFSFRKGNDEFRRDSVGLRPRGNTSRVRPEGSNGEKHRNGAKWHHAHFGVKFTEYTTGERFFGCDRLILKWFHEDPAYCREVYSYDLFHRFGVWSAPYASYCRLSIYIQGDTRPVYMGVYAMIENPRKGWLNDRMKEGHIPDKTGNMWKASWGADLSNADKSRMGISDDYGNINPVYDLKTNKAQLAEAQQKLADFINGMTPLPSGSAALKAWLEQHMDVDLFLRAYAVNVIVGMWDDYWINQNNYFFYFDTNHRFYFIPFDYDNTLGTSNDINPATQDMLNWGSLGGDRMLMRKVMSINEFRDTYKAYIRQLATSDDLFAPAGSKARIRQWQTMIAPFVDNDTGEETHISDAPASWSNYPKYRLLTGAVGNGQSAETNFFETKINSIHWK